jgi:mRNA interferase MazF
MKRTLPGEIWWVDFGLAAKVRPALILSDYPKDDELALLVVIPHTTAVRGNRWELSVPKPFLKSPGVFHLQQVQPISLARFKARLGVLTPDEFKRVKDSLIRLLNLGG